MLYPPFPQPCFWWSETVVQVLLFFPGTIHASHSFLSNNPNLVNLLTRLGEGNKQLQRMIVMGICGLVQSWTLPMCWLAAITWIGNSIPKRGEREHAEKLNEMNPIHFYYDQLCTLMTRITM